jgi:multiple sugar transport system substrate-binding protein
MSEEQSKLSRRAFLALTGKGAALALFVTSCGATPEPAAAPPEEEPAEEQAEAAEEPAAVSGTITFLAWGDPADIPAWDTIVEMYQAQNPDVTVERTDVSDPNANFYPKLQTMIAGGTPPHVSSFQGWEWQTYADSEVLAPIDDYVARDGFTGPFPEGYSTIDVSTVRNGNRYLIPMQLGTMVMFYAKKHFDDAGIPYPTEAWTMDEFIEIAQQLTDTSGDSKRFGLQANGSWFRDIAYIRGTGKQEFDELVDPKTAQFNQPEIVEMLQLVAYDVYHTLKVSPTAADLEGGSNTIETGNCAMKYEGPWFFPRLNSPELREQGAQVEFDVVLMPEATDPERPHRGWAEGIALPRSDNVEAAWDFASFMAGEEGDKVYAETTGRIPNTFELIESFWIPKIKERFGVENGQAFLESFKRSEVDTIGGVPRSKMWSEVVKPFGYDPMIGGSATAAEVLPTVDEELQKLIDDYWASA